MTKLITSSEIKAALKLNGIVGTCASKILMHICGLNKTNRIHARLRQYDGHDFTEHFLKYLNISCNVSQKQLENIPKEGGFTIVSNHPFGGIEGIMLYDLIYKIRPDFKMMANFLLSKIPNLAPIFLPVNPFTDNPSLKSSVAGVKGAVMHLSEGKGLGIFPAGEVSRFHGNSYPEDIAWSTSIAKMIQHSNLPVVPVYIEGRNSRWFYFVDKINNLLGTMRLPWELYNKKNKTITIQIGKPISPADMAQFENPKQLAAYLRSRSYALEGNMENRAPQYHKENKEAIALPKKPSILEEELAKIKAKSLLYTANNYECYLADYKDIPNLIHEIGRCREEAFRAIGEGTGKRVDLDEFDCYYKHLILWDTVGHSLAGAYRLGFGDEIIETHGIKGFYTSTLFHFDPSLASELKTTIELGRSFISVNYQKELFPLVSLFRGLLLVIVKSKNMRSFIGPVSISDWYPKFYQSLMVKYLTEHHGADMSIVERVKCTTPFRPDYLKVDIGSLFSIPLLSIEKFDQFMMKLSNGDYRMPTLVKKYTRLNAKFICFNVDPDFNDSLDGLNYINFKDIPDSEVDMLLHDCSQGERDEVKEYLHSIKQISF